MPRLARLVNGVLNYRLGYNLQRPYPWKWTTPIVAISFLLLTGILAIINIPLSAYDVVAEVTYTPNDTLPALPFSGLIPSSVRRQPGQFTPQIFREEDAIRPNGSLFTYTINQIYDSNNLSETVSSFLYYNNPLSSCDISVLKLSVSSSPSRTLWTGSGVTGWALISCWSPAVFTMTWSFDQSEIQSQIKTVYQPWWKVMIKLNEIWANAVFQSPGDLRNSSVLNVMARPCCSCDNMSETWIHRLGNTNMSLPEVGQGSMSDTAVLEDVRFILNAHPPCEENGQAAKFQDLYIILFTTSPDGDSSETDATGGVFTDDFPDSTPALRLALRNAIRATYHIIRLDFGIVLRNQIYQSPAFFNENMEDYHGTTDGIPWPAFCSPCDLWPTVPSAARTVVLSYLRPVFQLKPIGSAIASVFVATFAMVSALWKIFTFIAAFFTDSKTEETAETDPSVSVDLEEQLPLHDEGEGKGEHLDMIEIRE